MNQEAVRAKDLEAAVAAYQRTIEEGLVANPPYQELGAALMQLGRVEESIGAYTSAIDADPHNLAVYRQLGKALSAAGCWEEAVRCYRQALAVDADEEVRGRDLYWIHQKLGEVLSRLARWDEALQAFRDALSVNPGGDCSYFHMGQVYSQQGEWENAIDAYRKAIAYGFATSRAYLSLAKAQDGASNWEEALTSYAHAIKIDPDQHEPFECVGNIHMTRRQWPEAVLVYEQALRLKPGATSLKRSLGRALFYLGKHEEGQGHCSKAVGLYTQALELGFDQGAVHYHLGQSLIKMERAREAVAEFRKALEFNPLDPAWQEALECALTSLGEPSVEGYWSLRIDQRKLGEHKKLLIAGHIDAPKKKDKIAIGMKLLIKGWMMPRAVVTGDIKLLVKGPGYEREGLLSIDRPDVVSKVLGAEPDRHPQLKCGFELQLDPVDQSELYIVIDGVSVHWATFRCEVVSDDRLARARSAWRKYIVNDLAALSPADAGLLSGLAAKEVDGFIVGKPEVVSKGQFSLATCYLDLTDVKRGYLERFLGLARSPRFVVTLVHSALEHGHCKVPDPFDEGYATCRESFHTGSVNVLRFVSSGGDVFLILQWASSGDAVYFPGMNFLCCNSHVDQVLARRALRALLADFDSRLSYSRSASNNRFSGLLCSFPRPWHFYYDICFGLYLLHKEDLLGRVKRVFQCRGGRYFSVARLFGLDEQVELEIDSMGVLNSRSHAEQEFYIHAGGYSYGYSNPIDKETLAQMIVAAAPGLEDVQTAAEVAKARQCYPLLWFGVTSQKRSWIEQIEGGAQIISELARLYPDIGVVFDGWTAPLNPVAEDPEGIKDQAVVDQIKQRLPASIPTFSVVDSSSVRKLAFAAAIDVFIANKGTGSMHVDSFAAKPGVAHISNTFRPGVSRISTHWESVNVPDGLVRDLPNPNDPRAAHVSYSIEPQVILDLAKEVLASTADPAAQRK